MPTKKKTEPKKRAPRQFVNLTAEQVVKAWNTSSSAQEAADKLGVRKATLYGRILTLRKLRTRDGEPIPLKNMGRSPNRYTPDKIDELYNLADSLKNGD